MGEPFYIIYLKTVFADRSGKNPAYSGRAFARALDVDPGALSRIMSKKQIPSLNTSKKIATKLHLSKEEEILFISSVLDEYKRFVLSRLGLMNGAMPTPEKPTIEVPQDSLKQH